MWGACHTGATTSLKEGISQGFGCPQKSRSKGRGPTVVGRNRNLSTSSRQDLSSCFYKKPKPGAVGGEELGWAGAGWHEGLGRGTIRLQGQKWPHFEATGATGFWDRQGDSSTRLSPLLVPSCHPWDG